MSRLLLLLKGSELELELFLVYCSLLILLSDSTAPGFVKIGMWIALACNMYLKAVSIIGHIIENSERPSE